MNLRRDQVSLVLQSKQLVLAIIERNYGGKSHYWGKKKQIDIRLLGCKANTVHQKYTYIQTLLLPWVSSPQLM